MSIFPKKAVLQTPPPVDEAMPLCRLSDLESYLEACFFLLFIAIYKPLSMTSDTV